MNFLNAHVVLVFLMFDLFLRERERESARAQVGEGHREEDRGSEWGSAMTAASPMKGLNS